MIEVNGFCTYIFQYSHLELLQGVGLQESAF